MTALIIVFWLAISISWGESPSQITPSLPDRWARPGADDVQVHADANDPSWQSPSSAERGVGNSRLGSMDIDRPVDIQLGRPITPPNDYNNGPADYVPSDELPIRPHPQLHDEAHDNNAQSNHGARPGVDQPTVHDLDLSDELRNHAQSYHHHDLPEEDTPSQSVAHIATEEPSAFNGSRLSNYTDEDSHHPPDVESHRVAHNVHTPQVNHNKTASQQFVSHRVDYFPRGHLPPDYDPQTYNASEPMDMTQFNYGSLPNPVPERAPSHLRYLTVTTMIRNQRRWLREWVEYYLMMGVEHFIIYDNNSEDEPLDILQCYIDDGLVTYIPWPPQSIPGPWRPFKTQLEARQYHWFYDALDTCLDNTWTIHRQAPCQLAAFADALVRTKDGVSRWLASLDVDEYIFPRPDSGYDSIANLLRRNHMHTDHLTLYGNVFGTSGYTDHAARRKPGEQLQALMTENYIYRAEIERMFMPSETERRSRISMGKFEGKRLDCPRERITWRIHIQHR